MYTDFLLVVGVPVVLIAVIVWRNRPTKVTAKPVSRVEPIVTENLHAMHVERGATEKPTRTFAGQWFSSPDVSHLESPAFLRKQAI